jgi:hypothetical protein
VWLTPNHPLAIHSADTERLASAAALNAGTASGVDRMIEYAAFVAARGPAFLREHSGSGERHPDSYMSREREPAAGRRGFLEDSAALALLFSPDGMDLPNGQAPARGADAR